MDLTALKSLAPIGWSEQWAPISCNMAALATKHSTGPGEEVLSWIPAFAP